MLVVEVKGVGINTTAGRGLACLCIGKRQGVMPTYPSLIPKKASLSCLPFLVEVKGVEPLSTVDLTTLSTCLVVRFDVG